jgi:transposase-like protein
MARRGRPAQGAELVDGSAGSELARHRLRVILQTLAGAATIEQAAAALGINRSRFHALRKQFLILATGLLEPRPRGRKRQEPTPAELELMRLKQQMVQLKLQLKAAQIREEIALVMPHLLKDKRRGKNSRTTRRSARRSASGRSCR